MEQYEKVCIGISKLLTKEYSTSFSLGILLFSKKYRNAIYSIYGYVRIADEIVDTFHGHDRELLLKNFRRETDEALSMRISANPLLNSFQKTVFDYNIEYSLIDAFLKSMEMDLYQKTFENKVYDNYVYGSAEVVGLMCLKVFCGGDEKLFNELKSSAQKLGSAFQKVNFLRDIKSDIDIRGRIYLPDVRDVKGLNNANKKKLEITIEEEFKEALKGILKLPKGVRVGVYSSYLNYYFLFRKIQKMDIDQLLAARVRISNFKKLLLVLRSFFELQAMKAPQTP